MSLLTAVHGRGTTAAKPAAAAANEGYIYFDTDLAKLQRSNGATWQDISETAAAEFVTGNTKVATSQTTTSTSFADLATAGPSVTVTIGASGKAEIIVRARGMNSGANDCYIGVDVSGATTTAAATIWLHNGNAASVLGEFSAQTIITGLAAGSTTFKMQYAVSAGTGTFAQRELSVKPVF